MDKSVVTRSRNPWLWIPSLYFAQGIPYVVVMSLSVVMYKRLGISNTDIALYTSWLYLPWVIKPLWSPLVDITRTKRLWVVTMQFLVAGGLGLAAFSVQGSQFFHWSLFLFWIMAFASATHDIAADGFYMLALSKHEQTWWVGLRSTFYRIAMITGSGLLVMLAGELESKNGLPPVEVKIQSAELMTFGEPPPLEISMSSTNMEIFELTTNPAAIKIAAQPGDLRVLVKPTPLFIPLAVRGDEAGAIIQQAKSWNEKNGFETSQAAAEAPREKKDSWWTRKISGPLGDFLASHFPKSNESPESKSNASGNIGLIFIALSKAPSDNQVVSVGFKRKPGWLEYLGLNRDDNDFKLVEGGHFTFNSTNWNRAAVGVIQIDPNLVQNEINQRHLTPFHPAEVTFETVSGNIPRAWATALGLVSILFLGLSFWHLFMLPRPKHDGPVLLSQSRVEQFFETLGSFFQKPNIVLSLAFILLYRFDEAQLSRVISPFLLDDRTAGGLGLTTTQVGLTYGTIGVVALLCGGLLGGFLASRFGLKRMLPVMLAAMYLPKLAFLFLAYTQPEHFPAICFTIATEQFGYGFGFSAFMLYLLYFADGPHRTAHYALCTGFMALGMMIPGSWSGWLVDHVGYKHFFIWVMCSTLPGLIVALNLKIDPDFGKKAPVEG